ncbi:TPA: iron permease [Escherichia coli]|nr:iron permease [Escherichia coli]
MFVPFLIMLREGLEAALIVSLIASYLKRTQRGRWIGVMWIGVLLAAALCLGLGIFINETTGEFPQKEQELFEGIVAVIAVVILTWMVFWMRKVSRNVKVQLEQAVDSALQRGNHHGWALVMMVFFAVAREGLESVFFLLAAFQQDVGIWPPLGAMLGLATAVVLGFLLYWGGIRLNLGAMLGLATAVVLGFLLYWGGIRLNLGAFFKWTSLFILFVAAGLAAGAIRAFHEAGLWNHFQEIAFDMSAVLSTHSLFGTLMEGIFGYQEAPSVSEVAVWFIYLIPALVAFVLPPRAGATASRSV